MKPSEAMQALVEMCRGTEYEKEHKAVRYEMGEYHGIRNMPEIKPSCAVYIYPLGWSDDCATMADAVEEMRLKIAPNTVPDQSDEPDC